MGRFDEIREGVGHAWDSLIEGWRDLWHRAGKAMTRFQPPKPEDIAAPEEKELARISPNWGLVPAEVHDEDDRVMVRLEAPGLEPDDFDVEVRGNILLIRGEKRLVREERRGEYFLAERAYGRFERAIPLTSGVDESEAKAKYQRGVLTVTLPKRESVRLQRIQVQS